jgi:predicted nucleic acid-binding protein
MPNKRIVYWDSNVFLSHLNGMPDRLKVIGNIIDEIQENDDSFILTSSESIVEVAHVVEEKLNGRLNPKIEETIDAMWNNYRLIKMIDNGQHISSIARKLIRDAIPNKWTLSPKDAVHLASAYWYNKNIQPIDEFHTYDKKLQKFELMVGFHICEPYVEQMRF